MEDKDPRIQINLRAMEFIWSQVAKETKDGVEYVTYVKTDIPYLYYSGLVDNDLFSLAQWEAAFEDCLGEDGRYWISHEKMLALGYFRYCKTVNEPFDPLQMRVGKYTVDRLWKVYETSIIPSCALPKDFMKNTFDQMFRQKKSLQKIFERDLQKAKEKGVEVDDTRPELLPPRIESDGKQDYVDVTREQLARLRVFLDTYPSPRRKLEMGVHGRRMDKLQQLSDIAKNPQKSAFEAGKDFRETTKQDLKKMLVKASENATAGRKPTGEVIDVKSKQNRQPTKF